ncbi:MAG: hypothetical protein ACRDJ1_08750 [Actinomycetota bacterium]
MEARSRRFVGSIVLISLLVLVAGSVSSYIDAGSGSYIFQLVVGAFVGAALAVKVFWRRIRAFVGAKISRKG